MLLDSGISEIRIENKNTGEIIASINEKEITTNGDEIVVIVKPKFD